jgi:hypothetical protein
MRSAGVAHGARQGEAHAPRIAEDDRRQQCRALRLEPEAEARLGRQPRGLRPIRRKPLGGSRDAGEIHALGAQNPRGAGRRGAGLLVVVSGVARAARRAEAPDDGQGAAGLEGGGLSAFGQPELSALGSRDGRELHQRPPAGAGPAHGADQASLDARAAAHGVPIRVARRREDFGAPRQKARDNGGGDQPEQRAAEDHP